METIEYTSRGIVLGNHWGGGQGSFLAKSYRNKNLEKLIEINQKGLNDGSLDSGMGYKSLIGAMLVIETKTIIWVKKTPFTNTQFDIQFIGELSDEQKEFLQDCWYNS